MLGQETVLCIGVGRYMKVAGRLEAVIIARYLYSRDENPSFELSARQDDRREGLTNGWAGR